MNMMILLGYNAMNKITVWLISANKTPWAIYDNTKKKCKYLLHLS